MIRALRERASIASAFVVARVLRVRGSVVGDLGVAALARRHYRRPRTFVPVNVQSYLQNFATHYLSQRTTSEGHLAFVLRRRMQALHLQSERAAAFRARIARTNDEAVGARHKRVRTAAVAAVKRAPSAAAVADAGADATLTLTSAQTIDAAIEHVLAHFRAAGVLNDAVYAERRASALRARSRSARFIQMDLKQKKIAPPLIERALDLANRDQIVSSAATAAAATADGAYAGASPTLDDDDGSGDGGGGDDDVDSTEVASQADFLGALALARKRRIGPFAPSKSNSAADVDGDAIDTPPTVRWNAAAAQRDQKALQKLVAAGYSFSTAKRVLATPARVAADYFRRSS